MDVRPVAVHLGAEVTGVDLSSPLPAAEREAIWSALLQYKVLFFRDQDLDHATHATFAAAFGQLTPAHPVFGPGDSDHPAVYSVAKERTAVTTHEQATLRPWTGWHTDITAALNPPGQSILRSDIVPPVGGDTQWTDLAAAYRALSAPLRAFLDGLQGRHHYHLGRGSDDYQARVSGRNMVTDHPLVRVHPETGERALYVSPSFLRAIPALTPRESQGLLELLWEHAVRPEFTVRFRWDEGCVAFWDNRATAHLAPRDIYATDHPRQFWRCTVMGEIPVGPDGRSSVAVEGAPIAPLVG